MATNAAQNQQWLLLGHAPMALLGPQNPDHPHEFCNFRAVLKGYSREIELNVNASQCKARADVRDSGSASLPLLKALLLVARLAVLGIPG
jgi:hypothetical protein